MLRHFRTLRGRFQDAKNLFEEVLSYKIASWSVGALTKIGDLHGVYAEKLRMSPAPLDIRGPSRRRVYRQELRDLARVLDAEAEVAYDLALRVRASISGPERRVRAWTAEVCDGLKRINPERYHRESVCLRSLTR